MEADLQDLLDIGRIDNVMVCMFDVNDLKRVNDELGHAQGDCYLIRAARIIEESFGRSGKIFRIGGDEFVAYIVGKDLESEYERCLSVFISATEAVNAQDSFNVEMHIAIGKAFTEETESKTVSAATQLADERMYNNKRTIKHCDAR